MAGGCGSSTLALVGDSSLRNLGWLAKLGGRFIVFEGPDGSGKSTQCARFAAACRDAGAGVCAVREPGGTTIGERLRELLLDTRSIMSSRCEMLLYMAARAQLVDDVIRPALGRDEVVVADRFVSSTLAYQGAGGGVDETDILAAARVACREVWPDLVLVFDVDEATAGARMGAQRDRIESRGVEYRRAVREGYLAQVRKEPGRHARIDASGLEDDVAAAMFACVKDWLGR